MHPLQKGILMVDYVLKNRIDTLKSAIDVLHIINHEMCERTDYYCGRCPINIDGMCVAKNSESGLNIIIRQYQEVHRKNKTRGDDMT